MPIKNKDKINSSNKEIIWDQEKPRKLEPYEDGLYQIPYKKNPNEVNFMGGLGENVGHQRSKYNIERTTHIQNIYNMKTRNVPIFTFCEDAKKSNNIIKKKIKVHSSDVQLITETVKNVCFNAEETKSRESQKSDKEIVVYIHFSCSYLVHKYYGLRIFCSYLYIHYYT